ncbi:hypothetical protein OJAV_G00134570 [Oryzias javanicus]|uniref:Uncharacterized protein n=1 Tax=Oryzias javanicus TaxID=123683 RepID=A0A437CRR1_ORYJA|nr:hypothetical protein OJAV_G00134570 [Oryzias javanicus]
MFRTRTFCLRLSGSLWFWKNRLVVQHQETGRPAVGVHADLGEGSAGPVFDVELLVFQRSILLRGQRSEVGTRRSSRTRRPGSRSRAERRLSRR